MAEFFVHGPLVNRAVPESLVKEAQDKLDAAYRSGEKIQFEELKSLVDAAIIGGSARWKIDNRQDGGHVALDGSEATYIQQRILRDVSAAPAPREHIQPRQRQGAPPPKGGLKH